MGLEIWATGQRAELEALRHQLDPLGRLVQESIPVAMAGVDAGRYRQYLRLLPIHLMKGHS
jgi:hypothetical protein